MKKLLFLICSAGILLSCGSQKTEATASQSSTVAQTPVDVTTYGKTITAEELKTDLYIYASDEFEGRGTGDPGQKKL